MSIRVTIESILPVVCTTVLAAGCASSTPAPKASVAPAPAAPTVAAKSAAVPAPAAQPQVPLGRGYPPESVGVVLRVNPLPQNAEIQLFDWNADGTLRPYYAAGPFIGTDTFIDTNDVDTEVVLYIRAAGYVPQAFDFIFSRVADFYPDLRKVTDADSAAPKTEAEQAGRWVEAQLASGNDQ